MVPAALLLVDGLATDGGGGGGGGGGIDDPVTVTILSLSWRVKRLQLTGWGGGIRTISDRLSCLDWASSEPAPGAATKLTAAKPHKILEILEKRRITITPKKIQPGIEGASRELTGL